MSAVFKTKLRSRFIGPFTVVSNKDLVHTLFLPRKLRTQPVFYVGMIKPYRDPSHVNVEALAPREAAAPLPDQDIQLPIRGCCYYSAYRSVCTASSAF